MNYTKNLELLNAFLVSNYSDKTTLKNIKSVALLKELLESNELDSIFDALNEERLPTLRCKGYYDDDVWDYATVLCTEIENFMKKENGTASTQNKTIVTPNVNSELTDNKDTLHGMIDVMNNGVVSNIQEDTIICVQGDNISIQTNLDGEDYELLDIKGNVGGVIPITNTSTNIPSIENKQQSASTESDLDIMSLIDLGLALNTEVINNSKLTKENTNVTPQNETQEPLHFSSNEHIIQTSENFNSVENNNVNTELDILSQIPTEITASENKTNIVEDYRLEIAQIKENTGYEAYALCVGVEDNKARNGNAYKRFTFKDKNGKTIKGDWYNFDNVPNNVYTTKVCRISFTGSTFMGNLSLKLNNVKVTEGVYGIEHFENVVPQLREYTEALLKYVSLVQSKGIKSLLEFILLKKNLIKEYMVTPAGVSYHDTEKGGLLRHTVELLHTGYRKARVMTNTNVDIFIAGTILHDMGKIWEMPKDGGTEYTMRGLLYGHVFMGAHYTLNCINEIRAQGVAIEEHEEFGIIHCILSHMGEYEGGYILPLTLEAHNLHNSDMLDSKMRHFDDELLGVEKLTVKKDKFRARIIKLK